MATSEELTRKKTVAAARMPGRSEGAKWNCSPTRGTSVKAPSTSAAAVSVITYCEALNSSLSGALRWMTSAAKLAQISATTAHAGPAASRAANAKVVEVVTSPSAPRVTTFSEISSPANAQAAKSMTSGVSSRERLLPSREKTATQHNAPIAATRKTYALSGGSLDVEVCIVVEKKKRVPCPCYAALAAHGTLLATTYGR